MKTIFSSPLMEGQKFGLLTAVKSMGRNKHRAPIWEFLCDCGKSKIIIAYNVRSGITRGCGCLRGLHGKGGPDPNPARAAARASGKSQYNTGKPCHVGHYANRWTCSSMCIECERAKPHWKNRMARAYGLPDYNTFIKMKAGQGGRCAICASELQDSKNTHIDHCHKTNKVRGVLCRKCNHGLGFFSDNPAALRAAANYIDRSIGKSNIMDVPLCA